MHCWRISQSGGMCTLGSTVFDGVVLYKYLEESYSMDVIFVFITQSISIWKTFLHRSLCAYNIGQLIPNYIRQLHTINLQDQLWRRASIIINHQAINSHLEDIPQSNCMKLMCIQHWSIDSQLHTSTTYN